jgi:hypothetical protein
LSTFSACIFVLRLLDTLTKKKKVLAADVKRC